MQFSEVAQPRGLTPARVGDRVAQVERRTATIAVVHGRRALGLAPFAGDSSIDVGHCPKRDTSTDPPRSDRFANVRLCASRSSWGIRSKARGHSGWPTRSLTPSL